MRFSFVIPCYNSEKTVEKVVERLSAIMNNIGEEYEVILVNDASSDGTYRVITELSNKSSRIKGICLERNFGQHGALMAGLHFASGDLVVTLDDDGQTPIEKLPLLIKKMSEGYDVVSAKYIERNQKSLLRRVGSWADRLMSKWLIQCPEDVMVSVFLLMKKNIVEEICNYTGPYPYLAGLILRTTQNVGNVEMEQLKRIEGKSGYSLRKLLSLWVNGFTAFSIKPLRVATTLGMSSSLIGIIIGMGIIIRKILNVNIQVGWSSIICVLLFMGGLILFTLGVLGEYIGRIYLTLNFTPQYVIKEKTWD